MDNLVECQFGKIPGTMTHISLVCVLGWISFGALIKYMGTDGTENLT